MHPLGGGEDRHIAGPAGVRHDQSRHDPESVPGPDPESVPGPDPDRRARLTGRLDDSLFTAWEIPRLDSELLRRLRNVPDTSSAVSDALDELGVGGCVSAATLGPLRADEVVVVVGQSVTLRYRRAGGDVTTNRSAGRATVFGDRDLYGLANAGDIAVMDCGGSTDAAVVGALSARWARKAGVAACVVDGPVRDTACRRPGRTRGLHHGRSHPDLTAAPRSGGLYARTWSVRTHQETRCSGIRCSGFLVCRGRCSAWDGDQPRVDLSWASSSR